MTCSRCGKTNFDWAKKCDHCGETFEDSGNVQSLRSRPSEPASFAEENNNFALAMYGQLRQRPGNLFFSPFSIWRDRVRWHEVLRLVEVVLRVGLAR